MKLIDILKNKENELLLPQTRCSTVKLKELISENFIEIGSSGKKFGFQEILKKLPQERNWSAEISDIEFRIVAEDVAQLIYNCVIYSSANDKGRYSRRSSIWKKESNTWKMIFHQGTKVSSWDITSS